MSIFGKIKDAIFGHKKEATPTEGTAPAPTSWDGQDPLTNEVAIGTGSTGTATAAQPVDVEKTLEWISNAKGNPDLNWRTSIVDLMKLLDIDSSLDHRKELATELGYTGDKDGSAEMNIWLHKEVMRQLAANGGTVPASLLD
jgi:hypothetical protein